MTAFHTEGDIRFVQFPHPGAERNMPLAGTRPWSPADEPHARTFLTSPGAFRASSGEPEESGEVAFWGEWEGAAHLVRELQPVPHGPRWLCEPDPAANPSPSSDDVPPQNTDPFVWGDAIRYTFCRQPGNQKLRRLGRGSVILFGASPKHGFELDTAFVVDGWVGHRRPADLDGLIEDAYRRFTIGPMYGWGEGGKEYRLYYGATPEAPVEGMFSFVPCQQANTPTGFARPVIELGELLKPRLRMQARVVEMPLARLRDAWNEVVRQVTDSGLMLATRLELPE